MHADDINWGLTDLEAPVTNREDLVVEALIEAQAYRLLAQRALHLLHEVMLERDVLRGQRTIDRRREREAAA